MAAAADDAPSPGDSVRSKVQPLELHLGQDQEEMHLACSGPNTVRTSDIAEPDRQCFAERMSLTPLLLSALTTARLATGPVLHQ